MILVCPSGTYGTTHALQSGEVQVSLHCTPCPDPNQESEEGATSADQCSCKNGFTTSGSHHCQGKRLFHYFIIIFMFDFCSVRMSRAEATQVRQLCEGQVSVGVQRSVRRHVRNGQTTHRVQHPSLQSKRHLVGKVSSLSKYF
jgi:hypothetical protein